MAVPVHKLPELLRLAFPLPNFTRLLITYPPKRFGNNNPRHFYKTQGPVLRYHNQHLQVQLLYDPAVEPQIQAFKGPTLVGVITNEVPAADIAAQLRKLHDSLPA